MHEEVNYQRPLSVMINRYCPILDEGSFSEYDATLYIDLCCNGALLPEVWLVLCSQNQMIDLNFETRALQMHRDPADRELSRQSNVEFFMALPSDRFGTYIGVTFFDWAAYTAHCCLGATIPRSILFSATWYHVLVALSNILFLFWRLPHSPFAS